MAQKPLTNPSLEIEEIDQANNLVATYIQSSFNEKGGRIDVVVSYPSPMVLMCSFFWLAKQIPKNSNGYAKSILNAFLPAGYPHSVTSDYLEWVRTLTQYVREDG
jgi:hypothetical protein